MSKENNRDRWPELAKAVDEMRKVFGDVSVISIHENGKLVAGKEYKRNLIIPIKPWEPSK